MPMIPMKMTILIPWSFIWITLQLVWLGQCSVVPYLHENLVKQSVLERLLKIVFCVFAPKIVLESLLEMLLLKKKVKESIQVLPFKKKEFNPKKLTYF